jgi:DMSO/TMAO reductase YedYZ molybdopterin-dependent catalytic subunit
MSDSTPLPPGQQRVAPGKWPWVGERQAGPGPENWILEIAGRVARPRTFTLDDLAELDLVERAIDIHCVTRWSKLGVRFDGVLLSSLVKLVEPAPDAAFVSFVARSARAHSTSLPLAEALELGAMVALGCEGAPLPADHGGPIRMVVPGRYFYKSLKWLARIDFLAEDRLGYWEAEAGYHNRADPWREERYLAADLSKQQVARLLAARDFSGEALRSIDCRGRSLPGLLARGAILRDADFRQAELAGANFDGANLANAHFQDADLRGVSFVGADLEGTNFSGADLRGANLLEASLFGASFVEGDRRATVDDATRFPPTAHEFLTPEQADFLQQRPQR